MKHFTMFTDCRTESILRASSTLKAFAMSLMFVLCGWSVSNAQSILCPEDASASCADVFNFDVVGQASASNPYNQSLSVTYSDAEVNGDGCNRTITRTWTASFGAVQGHAATSRTCTQIISTVDSQGPVISGVEPVINVQCADDVPGFANASVDACAGTEPLVTFASHTGRAEKICNLSAAVGPGMDWALWLPDLATSNFDISASWVFDANGGKFEQYVDGTARLYGRIINASNPAHAFNVDFWFHARRQWDGSYGWNSELGRSYKNDLGLQCATTNHINWDYYEMVNGISSLTGDGEFEGDVLYMSHMPANHYFGFQVGVGANNKNCNAGISGWFTYSGHINGECINGHGDVNCDTDCQTPPAVCVNHDDYTYIYHAQNHCCYGTCLKQHILVNDTIAPQFTNCPANITQECSNPIPAVATGLQATDNCSAPAGIIINYVGEITRYFNAAGQTCPAVDACTTTITRTWEAIDECQNRGTCVQVITLIDTTAPVFNAYPPYISTECDVEPAHPTASDNCDANVSVTIASDVLQSGGCMGVLARTYRATDNCGNFSEIVQYIALLDNTAPTFVGVPSDITVQCSNVNAVGADGTRYGNAGVTGSDNCGLQVTVTYAETVVPTNDNCPDSYDIVRTWTATDYCENVATVVRYVHVIDTTRPVYTSFPADVTISCTDPIPAVVYPVASDNCDSNVSITLASSQVAGSCPQSYDILRVFRGTDNCGNEVVQTQTIRVRDTGGVTLGNLPASPITVECNAVPNPANVTVSDNCDANPTVSYNQVRTNGSCTDTYTLTRTWVGTDACGNTATFVQTINVRDTTAPVMSGTPAANITVECDAVPAAANVTATDNCDTSVSVSYNQVRTNGNCPSNYTLVRTWTATDNCNNVRTFVQNITVRDTHAPVITGDYSITRLCSDISGIYVTATDNCGSFTWEYTDTQVSGGCAGSVIRRYYATDACGNRSNMFEQTIHLYDNIAPVAVATPDRTIQCDSEVPTIPAPTWSDNCDDNLTISYEYSEEVVGQDNCPNYDRIYTWTAVDHCGNSTVAVTRVHVVDTTAPVFDTFPADVTVSCGGQVPGIVYPQFHDNCDLYPDLELIVDTVNNSGCYHTFTIERRFKIWDICGNERRDTQHVYVVNNLVAPVIVGSLEIDRPCHDYAGNYVSVQNSACNQVQWNIWDEAVSGSCGGNVIRHYTATNACGQSSAEFIQIIHLYDNQAPTVAVQPTNVNSQCGTNIPAYTPVWSDNCDDELETTFVQSPNSGTSCVYSYTQTWTATDNCGNTTTISRTISVNDNTDPVFTNVPANATYDCTYTGEVVIGWPTATDNCDSDVQITLDLDTIAGICAAEYQIVRTWTAVDNCGNDRVVSRTINFVDNAGPVFDANQTTYYTFECGSNYSTPAPTSHDACSSVVSTSASNGTLSGCAGSFNRTWTATDACGNSSTFVVYINVVDTTDPIFDSCPEAVTLPCDVYTLPTPAAPTAHDNCDNSVQVVYEQHLFGDVPPAGSLAGGYCHLQTPVRPANNPCGYPVDWGVALHTMPLNYRYYTIDNGTFVRYSDRVEVSLHIRVAQLPNQPQMNAGWDVTMRFDNGSTAEEWFSGVHGFKADCGGIAANANEWEYFILQSGASMTGWGLFSGSALSLAHAPVNQYFGYQLGAGANNYNADEEGFGGWFGYSGTFRANPNADFTNVSGAGDVCVKRDCCPRYWAVRQWTAIDNCNNSSVCEQIISWDGVVVAGTTAGGNTVDFNNGLEAGRLTSTITAQPNPANSNTLFTFRAANSAKTSVEIYDMTGKKVADVYMGSVEAGSEYRVDFNVSNLATGVYTYRMTNGSEVKIERLIISK